jgi:hypothetical protein
VNPGNDRLSLTKAAPLRCSRYTPAALLRLWNPAAGIVSRSCVTRLERPERERPTFLRDACAGDAELIAEVESLLAQRVSGEEILGRETLVATSGRDPTNRGFGMARES